MFPGNIHHSPGELGIIFAGRGKSLAPELNPFPGPGLRLHSETVFKIGSFPGGMLPDELLQLCQIFRVDKIRKIDELF